MFMNPQPTTGSRRLWTALVLLGGAFLVSGLAAGQVERFEAVAHGTGKSGFSAGPPTRLNIVVEKYSTLEDRSKLIDVISHDDGQKTSKYLDQLPRVGEIMVPGQPSKELKYIYNYENPDGTRQVVIAASRPYLSATAPQQGGNATYLMAVIAFTLDKNGKGDGTLAPAVEMRFVNGKIKETNAAGDPLKLTKIKSNKGGK
jgi:hypothetical protein